MNSANPPSAGAASWLKFLLVVGLVAWGTWSSWQLRQARKAGVALREALLGKWLPSSDSPTAKPPVVITAVERFAAGRFAEATRLLDPAEELTPSRQEAAKRFLGRHPQLRQRLVAATAAAEKRQQDGGEVGTIRAALAQVLAAAAQGDPAAVEARLAAAEAALDQVSVGTSGHAWPAGEAGVAARAAALEPAVRVGQALMTESFAAAGQLIGRAAWEGQKQRYQEAAAVLDLATALMGIRPAPHDARGLPAWFLELAQAPPTTVETTHARAAVELAEAVANAEPIHPAVASLVARARREFDAGQMAEADWWASVALAALAMDPAAVEPAVGEDSADIPAANGDSAAQVAGLEELPEEDLAP